MEVDVRHEGVEGCTPWGGEPKSNPVWEISVAFLVITEPLGGIRAQPRREVARAGERKGDRGERGKRIWSRIMREIAGTALTTSRVAWVTIGEARPSPVPIRQGHSSTEEWTGAPMGCGSPKAAAAARSAVIREPRSWGRASSGGS